jgi:preprotein translocase subunit SecD
VVVAPNDRFLGRDVHTRLGLDLQGGIQVLLSAVRSGEEVTREEMEVAAGVIERRVNAFGVGETVVQISGNDRIIIELPGVEDPQQAIETIRGTGSLEFIDPMGQFLSQGQIVRTQNNPEPLVLQIEDQQQHEDTTPLTSTGELTPATSELTPTDGATPLTPPTAPQVSDTIFPVIADGKDLVTSAVQPVISSEAGLKSEPAVSFEFRGESKTRLTQFTATHIGDPMCIVLDNTVVSCPRIQAALEGEGIISTDNVEDRDRIYKQLKFGALPIPFQVETSRTVTATLGRDSVNDSMVAGVVGLVVVALFMLLYYRLPGFLAVIALLIYTAMSFALYRLIPVTLTLAGIAGFVLSIGLAVDANVLIFARLKEELRRKKRLVDAIEDGFREAWPAIRDSSVSTLITSTILYIFGNSFGVSIIKGFALTLGLGILVSLFTAMVITRTLLRLIVPLGIAQNLWFFEIEPAEVPAASPNVSPSE